MEKEEQLNNENGHEALEWAGERAAVARGDQFAAFALFVRSLPRYESIPGALLSFAYSLQLYGLYLFKRHRRRERYSLLLLGIALPILGTFCDVNALLRAAGIAVDLAKYQQLLLSFVVVLVTNLALFMLLFVFDLPALFAATGSSAVWEWENKLMGHKLWSGRNTYKLLQWLLDDKAHLGRAKWLLVNFLSDDLEQRITSRGNPVVYEISVSGWPPIVYSEFLAKNMTHARVSILWVVDPRDFIRDILPAHVIEVLTSICVCLDNTVSKKIQRAANASETKTENLRNLLGNAYREFCPLRVYETCESRDVCSSETPNPVCRRGFSFSGSGRQKHFEYLWFSFFAATLNKLADPDATLGGQKHLRVGGQTIKFKHVKDAYVDRERIVGSLVLPHIDEFRKAACEKRRHVYLGMRPTEDEKPESRAVDSIRGWFKADGDYIDAIFPTIDPNGGGHSLFRTLVQIDADADEDATTVVLDSNAMKAQWERVDKDVKALLLDWAIELFAHTSGDKSLVKGVFGTDEPTKGSYHDLGIYDRKLEVSSFPGNGRKVVWRVFADTSPHHEIYFPDEESGLVVPFATLKCSFKTALCGDNR